MEKKTQFQGVEGDRYFICTEDKEGKQFPFIATGEFSYPEKLKKVSGPYNTVDEAASKLRELKGRAINHD